MLFITCHASYFMFLYIQLECQSWKSLQTLTDLWILSTDDQLTNRCNGKPSILQEFNMHYCQALSSWMVQCQPDTDISLQSILIRCNQPIERGQRAEWQDVQYWSWLQLHQAFTIYNILMPFLSFAISIFTDGWIVIFFLWNTEKKEGYN